MKLSSLLSAFKIMKKGEIMFKRLFFIVSIFLLVGGCATRPNITLMTPMNEPVPNPHYILTDVDNEIRVVFYYEAIAFTKDLDYTLQPDPMYLDKNVTHILSNKNFEGVRIVMKIFNPKEIKYEIYGILSADFRDGTDKRHFWIAARSNLVFRTHKINLSLDRGIKSVEFSFQIRKGDQRLVKTGNFNYTVY
jgi:hypothetical protein